MSRRFTMVFMPHCPSDSVSCVLDIAPFCILYPLQSQSLTGRRLPLSPFPTAAPATIPSFILADDGMTVEISWVASCPSTATQVLYSVKRSYTGVLEPDSFTAIQQAPAPGLAYTSDTISELSLPLASADLSVCVSVTSPRHHARLACLWLDAGVCVWADLLGMWLHPLSVSSSQLTLYASCLLIVGVLYFPGARMMQW